MGKILITGHTGFIGKTVTGSLKKSGLEVCGYAIDDGGDLLDSNVVDELPKADLVIHLAGFVGVPKSWETPATAYRLNFDMTLNVLEYARLNKAPVIYMSSYMYGTPVSLPINETHRTSCNNPYASSKMAGEMLCEAYNRDFKVDVAILRPFNIYGNFQTVDSVIPHIIEQVNEGNEVRVLDLQPKRDYLHVTDFASALVAISVKGFSGFSVYNIGSGKSHSVEEIINVASRVSGKKLNVISAEQSRKNEIMDCYADIAKFQNQFGWKPVVELEEGIADLLAGKI